MATHAHSTRTSLLRLSGSQGLSRFAQTEQNARSLLGAAPGRQSGPVTLAIAAMRAADPDLDRQHLRELRRRIADRIEADIALLDDLDGDADFEDGADLEAENEHGGDVQDEPHDPEEDGDVHEIATAVAGFDGTNYRRARS
ncbi:hypothetical protein [Methylobacterium sp. D48H]